MPPDSGVVRFDGGHALTVTFRRAGWVGACLAPADRWCPCVRAAWWQAGSVGDVDLVAFAVKRRGPRLNEQPSAALTSRVVIGQAKGVISGRAGVDLAGASSRLLGRASARYSRRRALAHWCWCRRLPGSGGRGAGRRPAR
jgi:hypothetical protein